MNKEEITHIVVDSILVIETLLVETPSALLTPLIALIAIYIAFQQHGINKLRLRHELYERRIAVYEAVQKHLSKISGAGQIS